MMIWWIYTIEVARSEATKQSLIISINMGINH